MIVIDRAVDRQIVRRRLQMVTISTPTHTSARHNLLVGLVGLGGLDLVTF